MKECHPKCIKIIKKFFSELKYLDRKRCLEVGAGDGKVTRDLLKDLFVAIDCFDTSFEAVKKLEKLQGLLRVIKKVDQATMQNYYWTEEFTCIFMRWCIGYLSEDEAIAFLKKAKDHLYKKPIESTRSHFPSSYIIVID